MMVIKQIPFYIVVLMYVHLFMRDDTVRDAIVRDIAHALLPLAAPPGT